MPNIRVMNILQAPSNDPKDRYINTLHFRTTAVGITEDLQLNVGGALDTFWTAIDPYIPADLTRMEYRFYDLADPEPREPTFVPATAQPSGLGNAYPFEVSAVLSYYSYRNIRRQRGRMYLGPLVPSVADTSTTNGDPQVSATFRQVVLDALVYLQSDVRNAAGDGTATFCIWSPTDGQMRTVTDAWMDNAFDTQRRRGTAATSRLEAVLDLAGGD